MTKKDTTPSVDPVMISGPILFDPLTVMGRDFLGIKDKVNINAFEYAFSVAPRVANTERKKGQPLQYAYSWNGHFNLVVGRNRVHFHTPHDDPGLYLQEKKLQSLKDHMDFFTSEARRRLKKAGGEEMIARHWLNPEALKSTAYVYYNITEEGSGTIAIADCHHSIQFWIDAPVTRSPIETEHTTNGIKAIEDISKGLNKALKAIAELRKFFARELESAEPVK